MARCIDNEDVVSLTDQMKETVSAQFPNLGANCWGKNFLEVDVEATTQEFQDRLKIAESRAGIDKSVENLLASIEHYHVVFQKVIDRIFDGVFVELLARSDDGLFFLL